MKNDIARKINILFLLEILHDLYDNGVDFVTLSAEAGEEEDKLKLSFSKEDMDEEFQEDYEEIIKEMFGEQELQIPSNTKLTNEDLDELAGL